MGPFVPALEFSEVLGTLFAGKRRGQGGVGRGGLGSVGLGGALGSAPRNPSTPAPHAPGEAHGTNFSSPVPGGRGRGQPAANPRGHCLPARGPQGPPLGPLLAACFSLP